MSHTISIEEAAQKLAELVGSLGPRDEIVLTQDDQPVAKIVFNRPTVSRKRRQPGSHKGMLIVHQEDDEHLKDFAEYMP